MREVFAHEAILRMGLDEDSRAPGAAITVQLCGDWQHEPPCPIAPHHTRSERVDDGRVRVRTLFSTPRATEQDVRARIDVALRAGRLPGRGAGAARWTLVGSDSSTVRYDEQDLAQRLGDQPLGHPTASP
jgi:hypothetical protein